MKRVFAFALLAAIGAFSVATAAVRDPIEGAWSFKTGAFDNGCVLTGQLMVMPKKGGVYSCQIKAREVCPAIKASGVEIAPKIDITADEVCVLTAQGNRVTIKSKVVRAPPQMPYLPDDFSLTIKDASHMEGDFLSQEVLARAVFYRGPDVIS